MSKVIDKEFSSKTDGKQDNVSLVTEKDYKRGKHPNSQANLEPFEKVKVVIHLVDQVNTSI